MFSQAASWACPAASMDTDSALSVYVKMVYVSVATATLCGEIMSVVCDLSTYAAVEITHFTRNIKILFLLYPRGIFF